MMFRQNEADLEEENRYLQKQEMKQRNLYDHGKMSTGSLKQTFSISEGYSMRSGFSQGSQFKKQNSFRPLSTINEIQLSLRGGNNQLTRPKNFEEQQKK
jgi:hypothetical protein